MVLEHEIREKKLREIVSRLSHADEAEREKARQELRAFGSDALPLLRQIARSIEKFAIWSVLGVIFATNLLFMWGLGPRLHGMRAWLVGGLLGSIVWFGLIIAFFMWQKKRMLVAEIGPALSEFDDLEMIRFLMERLHLLRKPHEIAPVEASICRLLAQIGPTNRERVDRNGLRGLIEGGVTAGKHLSVAREGLALWGRIGDRQTLWSLERWKTHRRASTFFLAEERDACMEEIAARLDLEYARSSLLRPSTLPDQNDRLLRPADGVGESDTKLLLRVLEPESDRSREE